MDIKNVSRVLGTSNLWNARDHCVYLHTHNVLYKYDSGYIIYAIGVRTLIILVSRPLKKNNIVAKSKEARNEKEKA